AEPIRQLNRKVVPGMTLVSSAKLFPGCTSRSVIWWCWPAFVCITPVVPDWNGPCISIVLTLGFHSPQVEVSDHTFQACAGDAEVSTDSPYSVAMMFPSLSCSRRACHLRARQLHHISRFQEVERDHPDDQQHGAHKLDRSQRRTLADWSGQREDEEKRERIAQLGDRRQRSGRAREGQVVKEHRQQTGNQDDAEEAGQLAQRITAESRSPLVQHHDQEQH